MDTNKALAKWVNSQIGKGKDKPYATNEEFGQAFDLSEATVRRLRKGEPTAKNTIDKLAAGIHMPLPAFLQMIAEMDADPEVHGGLEHRIFSGIKNMSADEKAIVWAFMEALEKSRKRK